MVEKVVGKIIAQGVEKITEENKKYKQKRYTQKCFHNNNNSNRSKRNNNDNDNDDNINTINDHNEKI